MDHLLVVPGNHDIKWTNAHSYDDNAVVDVAPDEATAGYRTFFRNLYGYDASPSLAMSRRFCMPGGTLIDVLAVNSSSLEQGKDFLAGMGRVQEHGFDEGAASLGWSRRGSALRVLALHHHLALTEDVEAMSEYRTGFGIAIDAPRTLRKASGVGVQLAVHGHKHRAFIWRSSVYELPEHANLDPGPRVINIVGGGSAGSTSTDGGRDYFNLFRLRDGTLDLEMYQTSAGGSFEPIARRQAEFSVIDGVGVLGEWRDAKDANFD
jgi:hypothetical protein